MLGPLKVRRHGSDVALGGPKQRVLLAMLLLHANAPVSAERLAQGLWGEEASAVAVKSVQVYIARLRASLGEPDAISTTPAGYSLHVRELDADRFMAFAAEGRRALDEGRFEDAGAVLRAALALWRGPVLDGVTVDFLPPGDIGRLEEHRLVALEARVDADLGTGRHRDLIAELEWLAGEHPLRERLQEQLMLALYRCGRQADALEAYRVARERLAGDLGLEPGRPLRDLQQAILAHDPVLELARTPAGVAVRAPCAPSPTIGREVDLERVVAVVRDPRTRIATLVGPGGVGKTRVAIEAAHRLGEEFVDGVWFVSLAAVSASGSLVAAIARAIEVEQLPEEPSHVALARHLRSRNVLLVLDNFEQLSAAAPLLANILDEAAGVTMLVTSREPLRLRAERVLEIAPLALEDAVALFIRTAEAGGQVLVQTDARTMASLCRRLDGLPLAIELAAAWTSVLTPGELLARLDPALPLLVGGARDQPDRQRTLLATIEWSHRLLSDDEKVAFARFSVFPAGATVAVAERVTGAALPVLQSLAAKHLITRAQGRLGMLVTVREFALEQLDRAAEGDAVREDMAHLMLQLLRQATPRLRRHDRLQWASAIAIELQNVIAALSWALERGRAQLALDLVGELGVYARETNGWPDGLPFVEAALACAEAVPPATRARGLLARGWFTGRRDPAGYRNDLEQALALFRSVSDDAGAAICLSHLAVVAMWAGRGAEASTLGEDAVTLARRSGNDNVLATAVTERAIATTGYERAARHAEAAIGILERIGDASGLAIMCSVTGYRALAEERHGDALRWLEAALETARGGASPFVFVHVNGNLGLARLFGGDLSGAFAAFNDALAVAHDVGADHVVAEVLKGIAAVAAERGKLALAARLEGAADAHDSVRVEAAAEVRVRTVLGERFLTPARARLGSSNWDRERGVGGALDLVAASALAAGAGLGEP